MIPSNSTPSCSSQACAQAAVQLLLIQVKANLFPKGDAHITFSCHPSPIPESFTSPTHQPLWKNFNILHTNIIHIKTKPLIR